MKIIVGVAQKNGKFAINKGSFNSCVDRIVSFFLTAQLPLANKRRLFEPICTIVLM